MCIMRDKEKKQLVKEMLPWSDDVSILFQPTNLNGQLIKNRFVIQPMEANDASKTSGSPTENTIIRYKQYAAGGAGIIWLESTAITLESRVNPCQLVLIKENLEQFARLVEEVLAAGSRQGGFEAPPFFVIQLNHGGRLARPVPKIMFHADVLDAIKSLPKNYPLLSDYELEDLKNIFIDRARLAREAGFHAVDVKACHGYLLHESLAARRRTDSKFGGAFDKRIKLLLDIIKNIVEEVPGLLVTTRLTLFDGIPYPWGWGTSPDGQPDLAEPLTLLHTLSSVGVRLVNTAFGNPYYDPTIERPAANMPDSIAMAAIQRMLKIAKTIKSQLPQLSLILTGFSWLGEHWLNVAAGCIEQGYGDFVGVGRFALAYPDFVNDLLTAGKLNPDKMCVACSACAMMLRNGKKVKCNRRKD